MVKEKGQQSDTTTTTTPSYFNSTKTISFGRHGAPDMKSGARGPLGLSQSVSDLLILSMTPNKIFITIGFHLNDYLHK